MKIILNIAVSDPMNTSKSSLVYELAKEMNVFFSDKQYGDSVETISINFLMTFSSARYYELNEKNFSFLKDLWEVF